MPAIKSKLKNRRTNLKHYHFSKINLAVVVLVVAGIGGYILLAGSAASSIGDANSDGVVNSTDLNLLVSHYASTNAATDFNSDGKTNITDLSILLSHFGSSVTPPPIPPPLPPPPPPSGGGSGSTFDSIYGTPYSSSSLDNLRVGDTSDYIPAYRFRADHTGNLQAFRIYWVDGSGYASGNGGTISMAFQTDDGTANHFPSGTTIGQPIIYHPGLSGGKDPKGDAGLFQLFTLPTPISLVQGQLYHLVFTNTDSSFATNWHSVDTLYAVNSGSGGGLRLFDSVQSGVSRTDWGASFKYNGSGGWQNLSPLPSGADDISPVMDLQWADGHHMGSGYIEVWIHKPVVLTASGSARETFTPKTTKTINKITISAITTAAGSLTARLETSTGALIQQGTVSTTGDGKGHWFSFNIPSTTLTAGQTYHLVWLAPTGSAQVYALRDAARSPFNFDPADTFSDGFAQEVKGGAWQNWEDEWSTSPVDYADLSFYFSLAN